MDDSKKYISIFYQILRNKIYCDSHKTDLNNEFKINPTKNLHIDIEINPLIIDSKNELKQEQIDVNQNNQTGEKETLKQ